MVPRQVADWRRREDGRVWIRSIETAKLCKLLCIAKVPEHEHKTLGKTFVKVKRAGFLYSTNRYQRLKVEVDDDTRGPQKKFVDTTVMVYLYHSFLQPDALITSGLRIKNGDSERQRRAKEKQKVSIE
jgi:hypothetical protein